MPTFRRKPTLVEAVQFTDRDAPPPGVLTLPSGVGPLWFVVTAHRQSAMVVPGDWIIPEPDGLHHYPVKPDIFAATYEPAASSQPSEVSQADISLLVRVAADYRTTAVDALGDDSAARVVADAEALLELADRIKRALPSTA